MPDLVSQSSAEGGTLWIFPTTAGGGTLQLLQRPEELFTSRRREQLSLPFASLGFEAECGASDLEVTAPDPVGPDGAIEEAIREAAWIVGRLEEGETLPYSNETWQKASAVLRGIARLATAPIAAPEINTAGKGSIDLYWESDEYQLLLNVLPHPEDEVAFSAKDGTGKVTGLVKADENGLRVVAGWLGRRR